MNQYPAGLPAQLNVSFALADETPIDPTSPTMEIWDGGTLIVPAIPLTRISLGFYYGIWNIPSTQYTAVYTVLYKASYLGEPIQVSEDIEVTSAGVVPAMTGYYCSWDDVRACLLGLDIGDIPDSLQTRINTLHIPSLKTEIDQYCRQNFDKTVITEFLNGSTTDKMVLNRRPIRNLFYCVLRVIPSISWYTFRRWRNINVIDSIGTVVAYQGGPEPANENVQPPYPGMSGYSGQSGFSGSGYTWESTIEKADLFVDSANGILTIPPRILYLEMQAIPFWNYTFLKGNDNVEVQYEYGYDLTNLPLDLRLAAAKLVACQVLLFKGIVQSGGGSNSIAIDGVSRSFGGGAPFSALIADMRAQAYATLDKYRRIQVG